MNFTKGAAALIFVAAAGAQASPPDLKNDLSHVLNMTQNPGSTLIMTCQNDDRQQVYVYQKSDNSFLVSTTVSESGNKIDMKQRTFTQDEGVSFDCTHGFKNYSKPRKPGMAP